MEVSIDKTKCTRCGFCTNFAKSVFSFNSSGDITVSKINSEDENTVKKASLMCEADAISINSEKIDSKVLDTNKLQRQDIYVDINIASGKYEACFYNQEEYDRYLKLYKRLKICYALAALSILFPVILLICKSILFFIAIIFTIILNCVLLPIEINSTKNYNKIRYNSIKRALVKKGYRIVYENHTTGTISYMIGKERHSLSIYKGYNSKWQSRYE